MPHIRLIPTPTPDGRRLVIRAVAETPVERLRRFLARWGVPLRSA
jgi:hypothetical protein